MANSGQGGGGVASAGRVRGGERKRRTKGTTGGRGREVGGPNGLKNLWRERRRGGRDGQRGAILGRWHTVSGPYTSSHVFMSAASVRRAWDIIISSRPLVGKLCI